MEIKDLRPTPTIKVVDRTGTDVADLLSDYKRPPDVPVAPVIPPPAQNAQPQQPVVPSPGAAPAAMTSPTAGAPGDVYMSGKKAGQPRPPRKVRATYTPSVEMAQLGSDILSGALFLTLVDLMLPVLIAGINNRFSKVKIKAKELSMTDKQKKELAPIADKVMSQINVQANPTLLLLIGMAGIYGMNLAALQMTKSMEQNEKSDKIPVEKRTGQGVSFDPSQYVQRRPI